MDDKDIRQESSVLSEKDRGAKGSSELLKNHHRATKGTEIKFITLQGLTSGGTTTDSEESGLVATSDVSVVFRQGAEATKQLQAIVARFDYHNAIDIPELLDESKPASSGRWGSKTTNLLENPALISLATVRMYVKDTMQNTPDDSPARQTQGWMKETIQDSISGDLRTLVDSKFDALPISEQGGSVYLKLLFDIIYNMTEPVIRALHKWIKNFSRNGLHKVIHENVLVLSNTAKNICKRLAEVNSLPSDAATDILEGLVKVSHEEFSNTFKHYRTLANQSLLTVAPFKNKTVMEKIMLYLTEAEDLYIVYTVDNTWKYKHATSYYTGEGRVDLTCFNCGKVGHGVRDCKEPRDQARIDKMVAEFREKKKSQGNFRNKGPGGQGGGGYHRKTFTKTSTGGDKVNQVSDKSPTKDKMKKKDKKSKKSGEPSPKAPTSAIDLSQLGAHFEKMGTAASDPNQAAMAQMFADLCQGKV